MWPRDVAALSCDSVALQAAAKEIRELCGQPRGSTAAECVAAIDALDESIAAQVVRCPNRNGKAALHFAAQNRRGDDCVLVCDALLRRGALVNATTIRGHTPLIFAAGRGRDEAVDLLLDRGANPRIICVTGHSAAQMGVGHVYDDCVELLEAAEQTSQQEWRDFREDPEAIDAQAEHHKSCPSCRLTASGSLPGAQGRSAGDKIASSVQAAVEDMLQTVEAVATLTAAMTHRGSGGAAGRVLAVSGALLEAQAAVVRVHEQRTGKTAGRQKKKKNNANHKTPRHSFKICLAPLPEGAPMRLEIAPPQLSPQLTNLSSASESGVLGATFQQVLFSAGDDATVMETLATVVAACGEEMLGRALASQGIRDRRPIRPLLAAVLAAFGTAAGRSLLRLVSVRSLVDAAEPHMAVELLMFRSAKMTAREAADHSTRGDGVTEAEVEAEAGLWRVLVEELSSASDDGALFTTSQAQPSELLWLSGRLLHKREGGPCVAMLLRLLRFAWAMQSSHISSGVGAALSSWQDRLTEVCAIARDGGGERRLELLVSAAHAEDRLLLPSDALTRLQVEIAQLSLVIPCTAVASGFNEGETVAEAELPQYELDANQVVWVGRDASGSETLRCLLGTLQGLAAELADGDDTHRLMIGIDTEWGDLADQVDAESDGVHSAAPAVMQLAVQRKRTDSVAASAEPEPETEQEQSLPAAWVIDCSNPSPELRQLTSWLLGLLPSPGAEPADRCAGAPTLVGFAFAHDIARLITLSGRTPAMAGGLVVPKVMDLQRVATEFAYGRGAAAGGVKASSRDKWRWNTPGLGLVCAAWLAKRLDKKEQCSDWDIRPLSDSQVAYAAADAAVLIDIAFAMGITV